MAFTKELPEWQNKGQKPSNAAIQNGYNEYDYPPASWHNWKFNRSYEALKELQHKSVDKTSDFNLLNTTVSAGGSAEALTASVENFTYVDGNCLQVKLPVDISDNVTLNVNGLGAKSIFTADGRPLSSGAKVGAFISLSYNEQQDCFYSIGATASGDAAKMPTSATYAQLSNLISNDKLITGHSYLLTDYRTKYRQPVTLKIIEADAAELLLLTAISPNKFAIEAFSPAYPHDVVFYDFDDNKCEDSLTGRNGFIQRRWDLQRNINMPHDWRFMKWARFLVDASSIPAWNTGASVTKDSFYRVGANISKALKSGNPANASDSAFWIVVVEDYASNYFLYDSAYGLTKSTAYKDCFTFDCNQLNQHANPNVSNITISGISDNYSGVLSNNVWLYYGAYEHPYNVTAEDGFVNNTFAANCYDNSFGLHCSGNIFETGCSNNTFQSNCTHNIFKPFCAGNAFAFLCYDNIFELNCYNNSFGANCFKNIFRASCRNNTFGADCNNNFFAADCRDNSFDSGCFGNSFGANCASNLFNPFCYTNTFGGNCYGNAFGSYCNRIVCSDYFRYNRLESFVQTKNFTSYAELHNKSYNHLLLVRSDQKVIATWLSATNVPQYLEIT